MTGKLFLGLMIIFWANNVQAASLFYKHNFDLTQSNSEPALIAQVNLNAQPNLNAQANLIAQVQFSEEKINSYARAVLAIEMKRAEILQRAMSSADWSVAAQKASARGVNVCDMTKEEQNSTIQSLCRELFNFAEQERRRNGFEKNSEFNQMTRALQQDGQLQERIRRKMSEFSGNR
jgi:Domain of unknown function (DUF4168)